MKQIIKKAFILLSLIPPVYSMHAEEQQDDAFLAELLRASEELEEENDDFDGTFQALAEMQHAHKEAAQKSSLIRRYGTAVALKMLVFYGICASYIKQCAAYINSYIYKS